MTAPSPAAVVTEQCAQVPLEELLERIPIDARYTYTETDGLKATHFIPIGKYAHEAAKRLRSTGAGVSRWIPWNDGDSLPMQAIYVITNVEGYVDMVTAERFERERAIAYWSESVAAPYEAPLAPTTPRDEK